jgi:hypothetical protein
MINYKKKDKGTAGLTVIISIITILFVIGLLTMIFALMGDNVGYVTKTDATGAVVNGSVTGLLTNNTQLLFATTEEIAYTDIACTLTVLHNGSDEDWDLVPTDNYTVGGLGNCYVIGNDDAYSGAGVGYQATYTTAYKADTTSSDLIDDTTESLSGVPDWFPIIIVIGFMVVLILLVSIIITAIRGTGLMGAGAGVSGGTAGSA